MPTKVIHKKNDEVIKEIDLENENKRQTNKKIRSKDKKPSTKSEDAKEA